MLLTYEAEKVKQKNEEDEEDEKEKYNLVILQIDKVFIEGLRREHKQKK